MADNTFIKGSETSKRFEIKRHGYSLMINVSADELQCHCTYEPSTLGGTPLSAAELDEHLSKHKILVNICPEGISELLHAAVTAQPVENILLARGTPMVPGEDGRIEVITSDQEAAEHTTANEGTINFRQVQTFINVQTGELIAKIIPPGSGSSGKTVFGRPIPPSSGTPVIPEPGNNVLIGDDGICIYATASGRVYQRGSTISVEDIYIIEGNVDFAVGNISFNGFVEIKGDILDGFEVKATKGIKVHGNIGVSSIESDGDIVFCGMNGQGSGTIKCGGSIAANYIYDSTIECSGNIIASIEIRSCQIKCLGFISVLKGGLTGGEYFALSGLESGNIGSITALKTRVVAGVHYGDLEELNKLFNELKQLVSEFSTTSKGSADLKEFAGKRAEITARTQEVRSRSYDKLNPKVNVRNKLFDGVTITLGMTTETFTEVRKGPVSIIENTIDGGFRYLGMTSLNLKAQTIELSFEQQHILQQQKQMAEIRRDEA